MKLDGFVWKWLKTRWTLIGLKDYVFSSGAGKGQAET